MRRDVGNTQGTAPLVCRAEDQEAGPVGAPGQWPPSPSQGLCGRRGAEAQQGHDIGIFRYCKHIAVTSETISRFFYPDIRISRYFLQYRDHIGPDIGEKPDIGFGKERYVPILTRYRSRYREKLDIGPDIVNIGFGKERVCPDIVPISAPILPISGPISGKMTRSSVNRGVLNLSKF